jgi:phosphate-selective porin OprO and OprP
MIFNKKLVLAVSGAILLMAGQAAQADSTTDIVDALVMKGVLTEEEGRLITKGHTSKAEKTPVAKEKDKNFTIESANGENSISLTGRVHFDGRAYDYNRDDNFQTATVSSVGADTFDIRRARIGIKYKFGKYYSGEVTANTVGTSSDVLDVGYLDVAWFEQAKFRFGQFKMPFSLEQLTSSNNIGFIERSFVDSFIPAKERGVQVFGEPVTGFTYALAASNGTGATGTSITGAEGDVRVDNKDIIGRVTVNFAELMKNKEAVFHLGGAFSAGDSPVGSGFGTFRTEARGATYFVQPVLKTDSSIDHTIDRKRFGLEFAAATGPFKIQTQYVKVDHSFQTQTIGSMDADVKTYYIEGLWTLTGEKHADRYKAGAFGGIKPNKEFDASTFTGGAWELGARYSSLDASDFNNSASTSSTNMSTVATGFTRAKGYTVGVKFLPNMNSRFMLEYVGTDWENPVGAAVAAGGIAVNGKNETQEKALMFRTQFMF